MPKANNKRPEKDNPIRILQNFKTLQYGENSLTHLYEDDADQVHVLQTVDVPLKVDLNDLGDKKKGRLLSELQQQILKLAMVVQPAKRYSKKEVKKIIEDYVRDYSDEVRGIIDEYARNNPNLGIVAENQLAQLVPPYGLIKTAPPLDQKALYVVYKGAKHHKALGKGSFGKAKLIQEIETGTWYVDKVISGTQRLMTLQEMRTLKKLDIGRSTSLLSRETKFEVFINPSPPDEYKKTTPKQIHLYKAQKSDESKLFYYNDQDQKVFLKEGQIFYRIDDDFFPLEKQHVTSPQKLKKQQDLINSLDSEFNSASNESTPCKNLTLAKEVIEITAKRGHTKGSETDNLIMDYAEGNTIQNVICSHINSLSAMQLMQIALQSAQKVYELHGKKYLHCDIKPANMMYDFITNKVTLIDHGFTTHLQHTNKISSFHLRGTPHYMAPEMEQKDSNEMYTYSSATEVYALGISLKEILGFDHIGRSDDKTPIYATSLFNENHQLKQFLNKMTDQDVSNRPTMKVVVEQLENFKKELLPLYPVTTGLIRMDDLLELDSDDDDSPIMEALKSVDTVILTDTRGQNRDAFYYSQIKQNLKRAGIAVRNEVLIGKNPEALVQKVYEMDLEHPNRIAEPTVYFLEPVNKPIPSLKLSQKIEMHPGQAVEDHQNQMQKTHLTHKESEIKLIKSHVFQGVQEILLGLVYNLEHKKNKKPGDKNRIKLIKDVLFEIKEDYESKKLNYNDLYAKLKNLEKNLLKKFRFPLVWRFSKTTTSVHSLKVIAKELSSKSEELLAKIIQEKGKKNLKMKND